ncbi:PTS ascorbate transporter subunit IIC [Bacillus cereus group sp. MYBK249-1]|uniref:PTS ascorbate transporter subunit IIC n=1 Tax=Bacillus thuringiensis serovar toumanoffi TaxID=180862 RepID=A0ABD5HS29_BACTU|nr:ascorbate-specific PTS system enzyme IIC [Bacillus thuringiensis IBL 200]ETE88986.1 PTS ascorbate transporter subunit IIC [Bacillus thuringiensis serovar aizawai str. Hu4-2]MDW9207738.1 PTS ascorbate transporter subunit IIC [Bacillus thuringiensis serovar toumanoffi]MDW9207773.1 PTS ascorbate transporter subunit IIC [Bacillus thuringiensis serovar toumanoffi]
MNLGNVWDWDFFWGIFGFLLKSTSPFVLIIVAIIAVGLLIGVIISAVRQKKS